MDEFLRSLLLVLCGLGAFVLLIVTYLWYFVFGRSLRAVLMAGLSILLNRDSRIDLDADVKLVKRPMDVKNEMPQEVEALDFQQEVSSKSAFVPRMPMPDADQFYSQQAVRDPKLLVSVPDNQGRFRRLVRGIVRPFLNSRFNPIGNTPPRNVQRGNDMDKQE